MASKIAEEFMHALQESERTGEVEPLVKLFTDDAEITNIALKQPLQGRAGVRQFWRDYLNIFDHIASQFTHVTEANDTAVLEWHAEGALKQGRPIRYLGVTVIETDGAQVRRFRSYYDSAQFLQPLSHTAA